MDLNPYQSPQTPLPTPPQLGQRQFRFPLTLTELLVILAVIAILVSLLMPTIHS